MENIRVMISEEDVNKRIAEMGAQISKDYAGKEVHLIMDETALPVCASDYDCLYLCLWNVHIQLALKK